MKAPKIHDGERVRSQMAKASVSQVTLADHLGVSPSTLSRMLNEASWRTDQLTKAGEFLTVNFFTPYSGSGKTNSPILGIVIAPEALKDPEIFQKLREQLREDDQV